MIDALREGGKRALAAQLAALETRADDPDMASLLDQALAEPKGVTLGLTGPPGVGKSTLIDALIRQWRGAGQTVGVIAVDPSSARSGGALLGDRTRFTTDPADAGVFVRSMAARSRLGGVADQTFPAMVLMRALFDRVIVETVGVGQSEIAVADTADLVVFCAQPGSGDSLQYMKAGVMEVPDLVLVTKADMGAVAERTRADLAGALSLATASGEIAVLGCSATTGEGLDAVCAAIDGLADRRSSDFSRSRAEQATRWAEGRIRDRFGSFGLEMAHRVPVDNSQAAPFRRMFDTQMRLSEALTAAFL